MPTYERDLLAFSSEEWLSVYESFEDRVDERTCEGGKRIKYGRQPVGLFIDDDAPKVSVITVVFNAAETLRRTIESVLAQNYSNVEYILIDGGSTDGSLEIIREYEDQIDYYVSQPDSGVYEAMNRGIALSTGDFVSILNADDFFDRDFISTHVCHGASKHSDILVGSIRQNDQIVSPVEMTDGIFFGHLNFFHGTFLVARQAYSDLGPYSEQYRIISDFLWVQNAYSNGSSFTINTDAVVNFSDGGLSSGNTPDRQALLFREASHATIKRFDFITDVDAELIYKLRFSKRFVFGFEKIVARYKDASSEIISAFRGYFLYCLTERSSFRFSRGDVKTYLLCVLRVCRLLDISWSKITFDEDALFLSEAIAQIESLSLLATENEAAKKPNQVALHYVEKFSSPSETFIFDFVRRLEDTSDYLNVVLCDERVLDTERPFSNCVVIPWSKIPKHVARFLYLEVFERLNIDVIVAHFIASARWLFERLDPIEVAYPTVIMAHGIDVFSMRVKSDYAEFVRNRFIPDPTIRFTAPSKYLIDEMVESGIPIEKIDFVNNVAHDRFFENRKTSGFYSPGADLKILCVGRPIPLKGHQHLFEALSILAQKTPEPSISLTLIGVGEGEQRQQLETQIAALSLEHSVECIGFVDLDEHEDLFSKYDILVMPSKYAEPPIVRAESFGMVVLEAIAAGLHVIITDAGGPKEITDGNSVYSTLVAHSDSDALATAIWNIYSGAVPITDNAAFAKERLNHYSGAHQVSRFKDVVAKTTTDLKVTIFSSIMSGGAGSAASRVHMALLNSNVESTFVTRNNIQKPRGYPLARRLETDSGQRWELFQSDRNRHAGNTIFTINEPRIRNETLAEYVENADVICLQWTARFLSVENIAFLLRQNKPVVLVVRDMQPLTGGCHYFHGCENWKQDCRGCPQLPEDEFDFPNRVFEYKRDNWDIKNLTVVVLSEHSKRIVQQSPLLSDCRVEKIFNPIDLDTFRPVVDSDFRERHNISESATVLFFIPSYRSKVKGLHHFLQVMDLLKLHPIELVVVTAGSATFDRYDLPCQIVSLGELADQSLLAEAYSACDITVVPSSEETFSNTAAESVACGTPIIGFATGAIAEIAGNGQRGYALEVGDIFGMANAILALQSRPIPVEQCREFAENEFSANRQGNKYKNLFDELVDNQTLSSAAPASSRADLPWIAPIMGAPLLERAFRSDFEYRLTLDERRMKEDERRVKEYFKNKCNTLAWRHRKLLGEFPAGEIETSNDAILTGRIGRLLDAVGLPTWVQIRLTRIYAATRGERPLDLAISLLVYGLTLISIVSFLQDPSLVSDSLHIGATVGLVSASVMLVFWRYANQTKRNLVNRVNSLVASREKFRTEVVKLIK